MKKWLVLGSAVVLALQVGCSKDEEMDDKNVVPETEESKGDTSYWMHEQIYEIADIGEDLKEDITDGSFSEEEKRELQSELADLKKTLVSKRATEYVSDEQLKDLQASHDLFENVVNDDKATMESAENAIGEVKAKFGDLFPADTDMDKLVKTDIKVWMDEFALDAYDLVEDGKEYLAGDEDAFEIKKDIMEIKADRALDRISSDISDVEKTTHEEIMTIINNIEGTIDSDKEALKTHFDELDVKLKEKFTHITDWE